MLTIGAALGCAAEATPATPDRDAADPKVAVAGDGFDAWRDSLPRAYPSGYHVVEGDMIMSDAELRAYYDERVDPEGALILHSVENDGVTPVTQYVWDSITRQSLTYCISNNFNTLGPNAKQSVISMMSFAAQQWQSATHSAVHFVYRPEQDATCTNTNNNVIFNVEVNSAAYCAARGTPFCCSNNGNCSFFPDQKDWTRDKRILFLSTAFPNTSIVDQAATVMHELGHILGFGHEHSWFKGTSLDCKAENEVTFIPLTRYDNNSIMHYIGCPTSGPNIGQGLTIWDQRGAQCAYQGLCEWMQIAGPNSVRDIDVDQSANVWSVSNTLKDGGGYFIQKWNHSTLRWDRDANAPAALRVTVDNSGQPWTINTKHEINRRASNGTWSKLSGAANDISAGADGSVWIVNNHAVNGGFALSKWNGSAFVEQTGIFGVRIAVDRNGAPWVLTPDGSIFHRENGAWPVKPGAAFDIDAGSDGSVWAIGTNGAVWQWNAAFSIWELATGAGQSIAVAQNGQPWVVGYDNATYLNRWAP